MLIKCWRCGQAITTSVVLARCAQKRNSTMSALGRGNEFNFVLASGAEGIFRKITADQTNVGENKVESFLKWVGAIHELPLQEGFPRHFIWHG